MLLGGPVRYLEAALWLLQKQYTASFLDDVALREQSA